MIGKICTSVVPFYDRKTKRMSYKGRPVLVLSDEHEGDYTVLPVSTVKDPACRDLEYDIPVKKSSYPNLNLKQDSYIRTHRQTTVHRGNITSTISDLRSEYEDLYLEVLEKLEQFNSELLSEALS